MLAAGSHWFLSIVPSFDATIDITSLPIPAVPALLICDDVFLKESDPGVSVVCFRVRAGGVEHAFDRVCGAGDVGSAFDGCECWRHQHHQQADDADDDEQFEQRKTPNAFGVTLSWQRERREVTARVESWESTVQRRRPRRALSIWLHAAGDAGGEHLGGEL